MRRYLFSTCSSASYDTKLALYSGSCGSEVALGCNDDGSAGCAGFTSELNVQGLHAGTPYLLQVGGFGPTDSGTGDITITPVAGTQNYCDTVPNSAGPGALITSSGSVSVSADDLVLEVSGAPPAEFGIFHWGLGKANMPFFDGTQCIAGPMTRMWPILMTGSGSVSRAVTNADIGSPGPGDARFFQFFYRDCIAGSAANTSDALAVVFAP